MTEDKYSGTQGLLAYKERGQGPVVVLLHGLFGNADNLNGIARALDEHYTVLSLDLPGHGRSTLQADMSLAGMADRVAATVLHVLVERFNVGQVEFHLVGHSLGGKVAMQLAMMQPNIVKSLVVLDIAPVQYPRHHDEIFAGVNNVELSAIKSRSDADSVMSIHIENPFVRQFILTNLRKMESGGYRWRIDFSALQAHYNEFSAAPKGPQYQGPMLLIKGELSDYVLAEHRQAFSNCFSDSQFKVVQGVGHWLHAEKPQLVNTLLLKFLRKQQ